MNVMTELWVGYELGEYTATRGYTPEEIDAAVKRLTSRGWLDGVRLAPAGLTIRTDIETMTDESQRELLAAIGASLDRGVACASRMSGLVIEAGAFTTDERKRAAG
jgi:hypothetical protein